MCNNKMAHYVVSVVESMRTNTGISMIKTIQQRDIPASPILALHMHHRMTHRTINEDATKHMRQIETDTDTDMLCPLA
jgi:hypothetical protein